MARISKSADLLLGVLLANVGLMFDTLADKAIVLGSFAPQATKHRSSVMKDRGLRMQTFIVVFYGYVEVSETPEVIHLMATATDSGSAPLPDC